jgi:hypothetical protein
VETGTKELVVILDLEGKLTMEWSLSKNK